MFEKKFMLESSFYICMLDSREVKVDIPSIKTSHRHGSITRNLFELATGLCPAVMIHGIFPHGDAVFLFCDQISEK